MKQTNLLKIIIIILWIKIEEEFFCRKIQLGSNWYTKKNDRKSVFWIRFYTFTFILWLSQNESNNFQDKSVLFCIHFNPIYVLYSHEERLKFKIKSFKHEQRKLNESL